MPFSFHDLIEVLLLESYNTRLVVIGTALLGLGSGVIGSLLLLRKRSLMGDVLSHATLPGIAIAFAIVSTLGGEGKSLPALLIGATLSGLAGVAAMLAVLKWTKLRDDVAMGFVLSVFFGTGVAIMQMVRDLPDANGLGNFIYGKTASMNMNDLLFIGIVSLVTTIVAIAFIKEFTLLCFDDGFAASDGWPVLLLDIILLGLVTAVTVTGLQSVGLILVIAFLIIPAAAARFWTERLGVMMLLSGVIGIASGWLGSSVSALIPRTPAGAVIVLAASSIFLISMLFGHKRGVIPRWLAQRRLQRRVDRQHLLRSVYEVLESGSQPVTNKALDTTQVLEHRSWTTRHLNRLLARARRADLLETTSNPKKILLSESGFGEAARITRNHRLWELYLIHHADIAPSHVDRDADMVEHILGAEIVRELEAELEPSLQVPRSPHQI